MLKKNQLFRLFYVLALVVFFIFVRVNPIFAQEDNNFETNLQSTYTVDIEGGTYVEHVFRIKNLTPEFFITKYGLNIGSNQLSNIQVTENSKLIQPQIEHKENLTSINIEFKNKVVGKDKIREFSISYQNPDVAQVNGQILEVNIPKMANHETYNQHQVVLATPEQFNKPSRITPLNYSLSQESGSYIIKYDKLEGNGISAIFGDKQFYNLTIRYYLNNPNNQPAITQVSLPPDTAYQKINYQQIEPKPKKIKVDDDGNWIATYYLPANKTTEVNIQASLLIGTNFINQQLQPKPLPEHTKPQKFWPVNDQSIKQIAVNKSIQDIYQYTVDELNYTQEDLSINIERLGALDALSKPDQATCKEFTDVFITLARANQIPARRITGYAYSENPQLRPLSMVVDVLHTWPEYYNSHNQYWVPIDPTWGNTTLGVDYFNQFDLNHIVFAINGKSSQLPHPAGSYKLEKKETKDIKIDFAKNFNQEEAKFDLELESIRLFNLLSVPGFYHLTISNKTGQAWYNISLESKNLPTELKLNLEDTNFDLLPYEDKRIDLKLYNDKAWLTKQLKLKLQIKTQANQDLDQGEKIQEYELSLRSIGPIRHLTQEKTVLYIMAGIGAVLTITTGCLLVLRQRRQSHLHRQSEETQEQS
ncbi:MAG: transglutaminase domain-containing protein [Patescibacteria group bacterium]|nr:transglutaminase domain-containing protein [Patescibacteria group bacterium]